MLRIIRLFILVMFGLGAATFCAAEKPALSAEIVEKAVAQAKSGDTELLDQVEHAISKRDVTLRQSDLLPMFHLYLSDDDPKIQRLAIVGVYHFKLAKSQDVLIKYIKDNDPKELEGVKGNDPESEPVYSQIMTNVCLAILALGEVGDASVIPYLRTLQDVKDLKKSESGKDVVKVTIEKLETRVDSIK